ncbi:MAG: hypothetical protein IPK52_17950 [Chloroflexi bacterium]|nr:hypothetical protein [Chloroflexota bacterium]
MQLPRADGLHGGNAPGSMLELCIGGVWLAEIPLDLDGAGGRGGFVGFLEHAHDPRDGVEGRGAVTETGLFDGIRLDAGVDEAGSAGVEGRKQIVLLAGEIGHGGGSC